jgi:hypothetical protein
MSTQDNEKMSATEPQDSTIDWSMAKTAMLNNAILNHLAFVGQMTIA